MGGGQDPERGGSHVDLGAAMSTSRIPVAAIQADNRAQPRAAMSHEIVGEYAEAMGEGVEFPPIIVFQERDIYWLADGFHRYHGAVGAELQTIAAEVRPGTIRDAILFSCGANATHGLPRTNEDKRRAVLRLLNDPEWSAWSDREIARRCGVGHPLVASLRPRPVTGIPSSEQRTYTTRHGTTAVMNTAAIGRAPRMPAEWVGEQDVMPLPQPAPLAAPSLIDVWQSERNVTFLFHALEKILEGHAEIGMTGAEAAARFPRSLAHAVHTDRLRDVAATLTEFADLWEQEHARVRAAE